jgi:FtsP/CotA-like multicopper oxidase with cupredoxin domain
MMSASATLIGTRPAFGQQLFTDQTPQPVDGVKRGAGVGGEAFPTSPFILQPFSQDLPIPQAMRPEPPDYKFYDRWGKTYQPGPGPGQQDCMGWRSRWVGQTGIRVPDAGTHQLWPGQAGTVVANYPQPIYYHIKLQVATHRVTTSPVLPIGKGGVPVIPPPNVLLNGGQYYLPPSTIYGFNGTFPGPMINAEYGKPVCIRFENELDLNPQRLDRQNFGAPDWAFLTHLHNGHTAPECDGNPHHLMENEGGYEPGQWVDNLYLNYPAGGDNAEKQSFCWFHDHRMHHTGANVYKGMVGLFPIYDPVLDPGDETNKRGLQLPGRKTVNPDGTFDVKYDIPLALYDCSLDDGVTQHQDWHNGLGETHQEWWGKSFFRHYPNHGFVGDVFTVNGVAYPVLKVYRRKYRLRFLGASIARCYEIMLMRGTPAAAPGTQGQWLLPDGQQCMRMTQIASEGGLLPRPMVRDSCQIWPAKRREFVVDFTKYMDGSPTTPGDKLYLVNTMEMTDGRKPEFLPPGAIRKSKVPMMMIQILGTPPEPDVSRVPSQLREMPVLPKNKAALPQRRFELQRGGAAGGETEWLINGMEFVAGNPLAQAKCNGPGEVWNLVNGGGGWTHPMHLHEEEHTVLSRFGSTSPHPDDTGREDVVALDPGESVLVYRKFRTFYGNYVAHCHNLAHEDHNMMFGWSIVP